MITILHGDDVAASREHLTVLRASAKDPIGLTGDTLDITHLTQILTGGGLFEDSKYIIIEQLLSSKKATGTKEILELLVANAEANTIVIWENKELTKATLGKFPKATVKQFKLPQTLFQLMDSIRPKNTKQMLQLYHTTRERVADELILHMIARQVRILMAVKTGASITELRSASWQMAKLKQQAGKFEFLDLKNLHNSLYEIERQMKIGEGVFDTATQIDFLLIKI
jgi:DNA polymerase III delta subunit